MDIYAAIYADDQRTLQSNWRRPFWTFTCEPEFSQIWGMQKKAEIFNDCPFNLLPPKNNDKL